MGLYSEYLERRFNFEQLAAERKVQLTRISQMRQRPILVYAANLQRSQQPIGINFTDLLPIQDQLANCSGEAIDLLIETGGGSGETVEDIVKLVRGRFGSLGVIVPGVAKSAGTILAMAADEILMEASSALGPIDAQINHQGKVFSAHALLEGMNKIKAEVVTTGALNRAYIPILQNLTPGDLQHAENAYDFARELVTDWLVQYKFKDWTTHSSTGDPVTADERVQRAREIAERLRDHGIWKTHGRSIKIDDLRKMRLKITDYSESPELADAIRRYYTLLQITFDTNVFKLFETPTSQIMRVEKVEQIELAGALPPAKGRPGGLRMPPGAAGAIIGVPCPTCKTELRLGAKFDKNAPKPPAGVLPFPADNKVNCPACGNVVDVSGPRRVLEGQMGRPVVTD